MAAVGATPQQGSWWPDFADWLGRALRRANGGTHRARRRRATPARRSPRHLRLRELRRRHEHQSYEDIGRSLGTDYFHIADQLTESELDYWRRTRDFVDDEVLPVINDYWERAEIPWPLVKRMGELGIVGDGIEGYGCPPMSPLAAGLINMELNRGDGSLGTFLGVQAGLAMRSIAMLGSEEQKQRWLPGMARLEKLGAFALTEPTHGSDSVALETSARRDGDTWVINGQKKWIGNGTIADVVVVWARDVADGKVKGFLVEKGTPGYDASRIDGKGSLRAVWQAEIDLTDVRVPEANRLPGATASRTPARCWPAPATPWPGPRSATPPPPTRSPRPTPGSASSSASRWSASRSSRTGWSGCSPRSAPCSCTACDWAGCIEQGTLTDTIAALAKMNNTRKAREVIAEARDLLGGNGILLDYHVMRHMADMEAHPHLRGHRDHSDADRRTGYHRCRRLRLSRDRDRRRSVPRRRRGAAAVVGPRDRAAAADDHRHRRQPGAGGAVRAGARPRRHADHQLRRTRGRGVQRVPAGRGGCPGMARTMERMLRRLGLRPGRRPRACPSAGSSPSSSPIRRPDRVAGWCWRPPVPASSVWAAFPGSPRALLALATRRRYQSPDYYRRIAGRPVRRGGPHATRTRCCTARSPGSPKRPPWAAISASCTRSASGPAVPWLRRLRQPTLVLDR